MPTALILQPRVMHKPALPLAVVSLAITTPASIVSVAPFTT